MPQTTFDDQTIKKLQPGLYTSLEYENLTLYIGEAEGRKPEVTRATWRLRLPRVKRSNGKQHRPSMKLGHWPKLDCRALRRRYENVTERLEKGEPAKDPKQRLREAELELRAAKLALGDLVPFPDLVDNFLADYLPKSGRPLAASTRRCYESVLNCALPVLKKYPDASMIETTKIELLLDDVRKRTPSMAITLYRVLNKMYKWARRRGLVSTNPMEPVENPGRPRQRDRVLDEDELRHVWHAFREMDNPSFSAVHFGILTLARCGEATGLPWSEIDAKRGRWHKDPARVKTRKAHTVCLGPTARAILEKQSGRSALYVFRGRRADRPISKSHVSNTFSRTSRRLVEEGKLRAHCTTHDTFRRTGATFLRKLGVDRTVVKGMLGHSESDVTAIYDRYGMEEEMEQAAILYDEFIRDLVGLKPGEI